MNQYSIALPRVVDMSFLEDYGEVRKRLSVRLRNREWLLEEKPEAVYTPFLDFAVTCQIDVSDKVGVPSSCMVTEGLMGIIGAEKETLFADALKNCLEARPAVTMSIESYIGYGSFADSEHRLMIATMEGFLYGAAVVMYPGFLEQVSDGRNLFLIPSSVHEWLYIEDNGECSKEELTELLRAVNREVVAEGEVLSDYLYYFDGRKGEMRRA